MSRTGAARIYNLFPRLVGPVAAWHAHLPRIAAMGFDWIFLNPFHQPGSSGSLYSVSDYYRLDPLLSGGGDADAQLRRFARAASEAGLSVMMDLVVNHTAIDSPLVQRHPDWYVQSDAGGVRSPFAVDPDDPNRVTVWEDLAELDYAPRPERDAMIAYWNRLVAHYAGLGFRGFRCDAAYKIPGDVWQSLIATARSGDVGVAFFAETLGAGLEEVAQLAPAGFDYFFNSSKWWDFQSNWLLDQYEQFRHLAPSVAFPESHDTERLAHESAGSERESRFRYLFSACFSTGVMMPIGYEYGFRRRLNVVDTRPDQWEAPGFDISGYVAAVNAMKAATPVLCEEGPQRAVAVADPVIGLLRLSEHGAERALTVINPDHQQAHAVPADAVASILETDGHALREITPSSDGALPGTDRPVDLAPRSIRVFVSR